MFFFRKKQIVLDCFTADASAYEYAPVVRGSKTFPDWWTKLPTDPGFDGLRRKVNMRNCYGFTELFKRGVVLENWSDINMIIKPVEGYEYIFATGKTPSEHPREQYEGAFEKYYHMKLNSPWLFKEKTGCHFAFIGAEWHWDNPGMKILPGVVEYRVGHDTNVNVMLTKPTNEYKFSIPLGMPLVHIVPLADDMRLTVKNHLVTQQEFLKISKPVTFYGFRNIMKLKDRNEDRAGKCPFGF